MEYVCQLRKPADTLEVALASGEAKVKCPLYILFLKAVMGGYFAALGGHAAMVLASHFYLEHHYAASKLAFGLIFSGALVCIVFTGTDLVTSNCMNFALLAYTMRIGPGDYAIRMATSLIGNYTGAITGAAMLSAGTGFFMENVGSGSPYLKAVYDFKLSLPFWRVIFSAIGCNCYVCMAVWCSYASLDSSGAILSMVLLIASFAVAGFEHIVANFYTLHAALMSCKETSFLTVYGSNLAPTLIGNYIAGSVIIALPIFLMYGRKHDENVTQTYEDTPV
ncbi:formate/nitrite transporter family protein, putative [Babesia bigemina]|uniref:Formate-nitrite transporter n=1 Tax=Babesia bigemina TaxID=5866 RepID=A0A061D821_BABBI|nr:formate/nitrite transporter family protein, putative [Babesia bigemina]CDR96147.1 formate/nitrite transporter family protein, putative [Babesia bigemina]|eukprot:XP_012768333.1 formate/nitrite transporter family protein, putative [Babesia bigemina]